MSKGMTLIEVLFATAIFSFVSITLFALFKLGQSYWGRGMSYNMIQNDMKKTSTLLEKYLKQTSYGKVLIVNNSTTSNLPRDRMLFPVENERGLYDYVAFVATTDMDNVDGTGFLYFITFRPPQDVATAASFSSGDYSFLNINSIAITVGSSNLSNKNITLLSNNILVFDVNRNDLTGSISINMSFLKKTIGEGTNQVVSGSLFAIPLNSF